MDSSTQRPAAPGESDTPEPRTLTEGEQAGTTADMAVSGSGAAPRPVIILGDFEIGEKIGNGSMGTVYSARRISKDRPAAVKVLHKRLASDPLFLKRFVREADVMSRLRHPNIIRCYAMGKQQGYHYIAMELVEGHSVGDWLLKKGQFSVGDAVHIALACARALQHAHQNGLIHRDVKPDNLLLTRAGRIKLADLGLARPLLEEDVIATHPGHGAGTPIYIAPEQARDARDADPRSDLYSLGCVLYQMLTGEIPFKGDKSLDIVMAKVDGHFMLPSDLAPSVPECLDEVLILLLAPHPDDRYQSATDLVTVLEKLRLASPALTFLGGFMEPPTRSDESLTDEDMTPAAGDAAPWTEKRWYVQWQAANGELENRRWTAAQVTEALRDKAFVRTAQVSLYRDALRPLAEVPEFHGAVAARMERSGEEDDELSKRRAAPASRGWRGGLWVLLTLLAGALALGFWLGQTMGQ